MPQLSEEMVKWTKKPNQKVISWDNPFNKSYYILFIRDDEVRGFVETIPGQGFRFQWPKQD